VIPDEEIILIGIKSNSSDTVTMRSKEDSFVRIIFVFKFNILFYPDLGFLECLLIFSKIPKADRLTKVELPP